MASLVSTTVNGDLKVTGSSNLFFEGSASSNTFEPGTRIYGAGITLTGGAYTSIFEYTVPGGLAGNFRFFVKGTTGNVVVPTQVDVVLNHSKDITIKSQTGNYTPLHVKVLTNNNEDCLVQLKADTSGNANVTVYIDVIAFGDGSVSFSSFGSYTGVSLEHKCNFGFSFSTINNTDASKFVMDGGNTDGGRLGIGTNSPAQPLDVLGKVSINSDGTLNWGAAKDYGRLTWSSTNSRAIVRGESGKNLSLGANGTQDYVFIKTDGDVGIGTNAPAALLHVGGAAASPHAAADDFVIAPAATDVGMTIRCNSNAGTGSIFFADTAGNAQGTVRYNHNTDYMSFSSSGDYFFDTSNGSVGIGTITPGQRLDVINGAIRISSSGETKIFFRETIAADTYADRWTIGNDDAINNAFVFSTGANFASPKLVILDDGNVGIGETDPDAKLDVRSTTGQVGLTVGNTTGDTRLQITSTENSDVTFNVGDASAMGTSRAIIFETGNSERMRISPTGLVGIGTNGPSYTLQGNGTNGGIIGVTRTSGSTTGVLGHVRFGNTDIDSDLANIEGVQDGATDSARLEFQTQATGAAAATHMTIKSTGLIGIGTEDPGAALDVAKSSGNILRCKGDSFNTRFAVGASGASTLEANTGNYPLKITNADSGDKGLHVSGCSAMIGRTNVATSYAATDYDLFLGNGNNDGAVLLLYNYAGNYHSALVRYHNNTLKLGLNNSNSADSILGTTAISITNTAVGIGTASPSTEGLEIMKPSADTTFNLNDQADSMLVLRNSDSASINTGRFCAIQMKINSSSAAAEGTIRTQFAGDGDADLIFSTTKAGTGVDRMTINQDGVVSLSTAGNTQVNNYYASLIINNTGTSTWSRLRFDRSGVEKWGIGLGTDDKLRISNLFTGGSAASPNDSCFVIDNNGQIGINTDPDGGLKIKSRADGENVLNIVDSAGDAMFNIRQSGNDCLIRGYKDGGTQKVQIHTDGDSYLIGGALGIGTSGPETRLHVEGSSFADAQVKIERSGSGQDEDPALTFSKSSSASDGHRLGGIYFGHSGTNYTMIRGEMSGSAGGRLYIITASQTNPLSNSATETVVIEEGTMTFDGALNPRIDSSYTLGTSAKRWSHLYVDAITCGGAISGTGASITSLNGSNISSGTVAAARLGSGSSITSKFLRGDNTWQTVSGGSGTVTSVATSGAITGGTITTSGTISHSTANGYKHIPSNGGDLKFLAYASAGTAEWAGGLLNYSDYALFAQRYDDGSSGGALSGGQWNTRILNATVVNNYTTSSAWASLSSNKISLQAGTYYARVWAVAYDIDEQQINLANVTTGNTLLLTAPMSARGNSTANSAVTMSEGTFAITTNGHELIAYHWANLAETNTYGGGRPLEGGSASPIAGIDYDYDTYVSVQIWRVA